MASTADTVNDELTPNKIYTIEASVVTGFEEAARGEAKELFNTDVKTARGKVTWSIPYNRIPEVLKMGSIDNFKVVMHCVPHFHFSNQHDSLAHLQKMVADVDWESGLRVWRLFNNFPHPIPSQPEICLSPEDLVDVVIMNNLPAKKEKEEKKYKKGGNWKKNRKMKDFAQQEDEKVCKENNGRCDNSNVTDKELMREEKFHLDSTDKKDLKTEISENNSHLVSNKQKNTVLEKSVEIKEFDSIKVEDNKNINGTEMKNVSCKYHYDTDLNCSEGKFYDESKEINVGVKCPHKTKEFRDEITEVKYPDGTKVNNFEIKCQDETIGRNIEVQCQDETKVSYVEEEYPDETIGSNIEVHCPDKIEINTKIEYPLDVNSDETKYFEGRKVRTEEKFNKNYTQQPKAVIIKREDWDKDTKIEIKVLSPGSDENIFPAKLTHKEDRNVEPMDINFSVSNSSTIVECADNFINDFSSKSSQAAINVEPRFNTIISERCISGLSENEFASSVIEKLTAPPSLLEKRLENESSPKNMVTPPPTPTHFVSSVTGLPLLRDGSILDLVSTMEPVLVGEKVEKQNATCSIKTSFDTNSDVLNCSEDFRESSDTSTTDIENQRRPRFRVTCNRNGESHPFNSPSAAASFGSAIFKYHKWIVDLNNFDIEVLLDIDHEEVSVSIGLTKMSLHKRNMVAFGPTTLRATICYNMLRLCRIKNGDIICDPMCGSGAIPVEGGMNWINSYHLGGDYHDKAIEKTCLNVTAIQGKAKKEKNINGLKIDVVQWNIEHFPLRDKCVDVFISDLPFGHRLGNRASNRTLYPCLLTEMARTATTGARACLLTEDKGNFIRAINSLSKIWQRRLVLNINIGGLSGFVFLLSRTSVSISGHLNYWKETAGINNKTDFGHGESRQLSTTGTQPGHGESRQLPTTGTQPGHGESRQLPTTGTQPGHGESRQLPTTGTQSGHGESRQLPTTGTQPDSSNIVIDSSEGNLFCD